MASEHRSAVAPLEPGSSLGRWLLVGHAAAGKTTTARLLGQALDVPVIHLDAIVWDTGWRRRSDEAIKQLLLPQLRQPAFIVEGSNLVCGAELVESAQEVVWLDPPLLLLFGRLVARSVRRCWTGEEVSPGNRERALDLLSPRALWWRVVCTYASYRRQVFSLLAHRQFTRICSFSELALWLRAKGLSLFPQP